MDDQESIEEWTEILTYRQYIYMETDAGVTRRSCPFELEKNLRHQFDVPREDIITERKGFVAKNDNGESTQQINESS